MLFLPILTWCADYWDRNTACEGSQYLLKIASKRHGMQIVNYARLHREPSILKKISYSMCRQIASKLNI